MIVTDWTRFNLRCMRERRQLEKLGYRCHETDWEIHRGGRFNEVIVDVKISADRKHVWTLLGPK